MRMSSAVLCQTNGVGVLVPGRHPLGNVGGEFFDAAMRGAFQFFGGEGDLTPVRWSTCCESPIAHDGQNGLHDETTTAHTGTGGPQAAGR